MKTTDNTFIKQMFSVGKTRMKSGWDIPFLNYIKIK